MELRPRIPTIRRAGGDLVIVGSGWPEAARDYRDLLDLQDVTVLCDEARESFRLAGFHHGMLRTIGPRAAINYLRQLLKGHVSRNQAGDPAQQGGVLVIAPGGGLTYRYASEVAGDHAPPDEIVAAVAKLGRA